MKRLILLSLLLAGCVTLATRSAQQQMHVPDTPDAAYTKATKAVMALGAQVSAMDPARRMLSARLNKAVVMNVILTPNNSGTVLDVRATAEPGYILNHDVPEDVQAFIAAYRQQ